ncbi:small VCP/p97-interacting protein isoform X5 [Alexandromys fortis]|uniref:small VCP/p97-interacting protein isoform X5 n=1 Tax=Alexandromys fortis TaxID=100897 RepID=UPI0021528C52|nr:small VCP/p97-interacting protein isoform X5 [Microtus fortis]
MGLCFPCPAESAPPSPSPVSSLSRPAPARGGRCHAAGLKVNLPGGRTLSAAVLRTRLGKRKEQSWQRQQKEDRKSGRCHEASHTAGVLCH